MSAIFNIAAPDYVPRGTLTPDTFDPYANQGWFHNADEALVDGLYGTLRATAATVGLAGGGLVRAGEAAVGAEPDLSDRWFDYFVRPHVDELERLDTEAASYGLASQVINGLTRVGSEALVGGPVGILALESGREAAVEVQRGKTAEEAQALGVTRGGTMALGALLPFALPVRAGAVPAVVQRLGYGIGSNTAFGVAGRSVEAQVLRSAGYGDEAPDALDPRALGVDVVLGAFFGAAAHAGARFRARRPSQEVVDAAMTQNLRLRDEDSAARAPRTPAEMGDHLDQLNDTLRELGDGAVQQGDGWVARESVDTLDAPSVEPRAQRTPDEQLMDLEAQLEREAIQAEGEAEIPPEVAVLDHLRRTVPEGTVIPDADGKPVDARAWLGEQKVEAMLLRDPVPVMQRIVDCALRTRAG